MDRLVLDSWAWIEYMDGSAAGRKVEQALGGASEAWTSVVTIAEVVSKYRRREMDEAPVLDAIANLTRVGVVGPEAAKEAGKIPAEVSRGSPGFGLGDSFVLQLARKVKAKVLTGDPDFSGMKEAIMLV